MASNSIRDEVSPSNLSIKVKGDLGDFQIIEDECDSAGEDASNTRSQQISTLTNLPSSLVRPNNSSSYDSVIVKDSKNVQFGNNTYFNGPVTIKQVIQNNVGHDNSAYTKTDDDHMPQASKHHIQPKQKKITKKFKIRVWHKVTCSALCLVIIGGICAVISVFLIDPSNNDNLSSNEEDSTYCSSVMGFYYGYNHNAFVLFVTLMLLTLLLVFYYLSYTSVDCFIKGSGSRSDSRSPNHFNSWMLEDEGSRTQSQHCSYADSLLIAKDHLRIVSRSDWLAQPTEGVIDKIRQPVPWVIITHTATENCSIQSQCVLRVRNIQTFHIESKKWSDIGYNFLVGGDGSAYYGRGWDEIGAHTLGYNIYSIGIAFIGTFNNEPPPAKQLDACKKLIKTGVALGKLNKNYKLFAHRQLASTLSPGDKLFDILKEWPHFVKHFTDINELIPNY